MLRKVKQREVFVFPPPGPTHPLPPGLCLPAMQSCMHAAISAGALRPAVKGWTGKQQTKDFFCVGGDARKLKEKKIGRNEIVSLVIRERSSASVFCSPPVHIAVCPFLLRLCSRDASPCTPFFYVPRCSRLLSTFASFSKRIKSGKKHGLKIRSKMGKKRTPLPPSPSPSLSVSPPPSTSLCASVDGGGGVVWPPFGCHQDRDLSPTTKPTNEGTRFSASTAAIASTTLYVSAFLRFWVLHLRQPGRPDWANFSPIWAIVYFGRFILKLQSSSTNYWEQFLAEQSDALSLDAKWVRLHFGRFFHKLISSPCCQPRHLSISVTLSLSLSRSHIAQLYEAQKTIFYLSNKRRL
jgi:hypothetical protein